MAPVTGRQAVQMVGIISFVAEQVAHQPGMSMVLIPPSRSSFTNRSCSV
jgi:hypothetical protein